MHRQPASKKKKRNKSKGVKSEANAGNHGNLAGTEVAVETVTPTTTERVPNHKPAEENAPSPENKKLVNGRDEIYSNDDNRCFCGSRLTLFNLDPASTECTRLF